MSDEVQEKVIGILAEQAVMDPAEVKLDMTPEDMGLDSLGMVETIFSIEETFDVSVPFNANDPAQSEFDISSVKAIVDAVRALVEEQKG